jgi:hypothetical protein
LGPAWICRWKGWVHTIYFQVGQYPPGYGLRITDQARAVHGRRLATTISLPGEPARVEYEVLFECFTLTPAHRVETATKRELY